MTNLTVTLTDTEMKCMEHIALSPEDWANNVVKVRAKKSKIEIIEKLVAHCNANEIALAVGEDAQVTQAFDLGVVDTVANSQVEE